VGQKGLAHPGWVLEVVEEHFSVGHFGLPSIAVDRFDLVVMLLFAITKVLLEH
jgi:hypothetical protein